MWRGVNPLFDVTSGLWSLYRRDKTRHVTNESRGGGQRGQYLQEEGGGFAVVFLGGDVQSRQADLAAGVVLEQDGDHFVVSLLQGDGERRETVL